MRSRATTLVVLALAAAVALPGVAAADDQSVYDAFHHSHPRFKELRREFEQGERHWEDSGYKDPDPAFKALNKTAGLAKLVKERMAKRQTSSALGDKARTAATSGIENRRKWARSEGLAIRAFMHFDGEEYLRRRDDADRYIRRAQKDEDKAFELFRRAGVS
jgi:hypothetical protein